ncbi:hypothetical protein CANARDRAFT_5896 [[Candida] arabinofermentans NRRL YB-2248]|uniref:3-oxoacyl-[acyl-carrier-protein] synthase n=1 Tax=[Candida] arabinofermentans NRRL YB-2248 TaxID=983967 RepID=A0A1E4T6J8_9ASCO|nr:hypothetical protein CANARDRAFT_5896 [[Candida] arabinofermentans NRRL YB-2248]
MTANRVVVTGLGLVTPLGVGVKHAWANLIGAKSGLISTSQLPNSEEYADIPAKVIGYVPRGSISEGKYDPLDHFESHEVRRLSQFIQYAIVAAGEALKDANWKPVEDKDKFNTGVCIGSGIGSIEDIYNNSVGFHEKGYRKMQPMLVPKLLTNMASGNVSIKYGLQGPNHSVATACATGVHALGDAARFIKDGYADVMVAGASEAVVHPIALGGFARAKSLVTTFNDDPEKASRPFDRDRAGFVLGEGAGAVTLESLDHALARKAPIYAEITGYGLSGDASHITSPHEDGSGARRAMECAIKRAGLDPSQIDYLNAHATSTVLGDRAENFAIKTIFGEKKPDLIVSSNKGSMGHLLGASGVVEAIFTILALTTGTIPPTLNLHNPGSHDGDKTEDFIFNYAPHKAIEGQNINHAVTNSFGFGGTNASLCISKYVS